NAMTTPSILGPIRIDMTKSPPRTSDELASVPQPNDSAIRRADYFRRPMSFRPAHGLSCDACVPGADRRGRDLARTDGSHDRSDRPAAPGRSTPRRTDPATRRLG